MASADTNPPDLGYEQGNLRHVVITATCFAFLLSTVSVALRLWVRKVTNTGLFLDDYLILASLYFLYGISVAGIVLLYNGLGTHMIYVPPDQLVVYLKTLSSGAFLYPACITCVKLSMLALYKRIFSRGPMVALANAVAAVVFLWGYGVCLVAAFTCIPSRKMWDPTVPGGCINLAQFYYGLQIPNIVTDAIIIAMPMKMVANLHISKTRKTVLSGIFALGILTLIFDIIRLVTLIELSQAGNDITYNQVPSSVWTCIEPAVGITAACLINMRPLVTHYISERAWWSRLQPKLLSSSWNSIDK